MKSTIAANVKRIIKEKGLKQCAVAARAGYKDQTFSAMMNNRKLITDCDILPIANALEVTPNDLFAVEDTKISRFPAKQ